MLPEPDEQENKPKLQTQPNGDGPGKPPRRTAVGSTDPGAEPESFTPLKWWQMLLARGLTFLLAVNQKNLDRDESDLRSKE